MKLVLRILPTVFVLISSTAFADATFSGLIPHSVFLGNSEAFVGQLSGYPPELSYEQFVSLFDAKGVTPAGWFGPDNQQYFPGESVLGPTTITWDDPGGLQIGSTFYPGQFELFPTVLDLPFVTLPPKGNLPFTSVDFPRFVLELDGRLLTGCDGAGCNFTLRSTPGNLGFEWLWQNGAWVVYGATLSVPEPGTLSLFAFGIVAVGWRKFRSASLARGRSVISV